NESGDILLFNSNIASPTNYIYNNAFVSSTYAFRENSGGGTYVLKNNLFVNSVISDFNIGGCGDITMLNAATTSSTLPCGTNNRTGQTFTFTASSTGDYHLDSSDASARSFGLDLSGDANLEFSTDIDGEYRSG